MVTSETLARTKLMSESGTLRSFPGDASSGRFFLKPAILEVMKMVTTKTAIGPVVERLVLAAKGPKLRFGFPAAAAGHLEVAIVLISKALRSLRPFCPPFAFSECIKPQLSLMLA